MILTENENFEGMLNNACTARETEYNPMNMNSRIFHVDIM